MMHGGSQSAAAQAGMHTNTRRENCGANRARGRARQILDTKVGLVEKRAAVIQRM